MKTASWQNAAVILCMLFGLVLLLFLAANQDEVVQKFDETHAFLSDNRVKG